MNAGPLSEAERSRILDDTLRSLRSPLAIVDDPFDGGDRIVAGGPVITKRGRTWAEVTYDTPLTHPANIFLHAFITVLSCGLYLPWWFYKTFKQPGVHTLSIDEYGEAAWTDHKITPGQRVLRYVLLAVLLAIAAFWIVGIVGYLAGVEVNLDDYRGY